MQVASIFDDSTFGLDLEKIRTKIVELYTSLLVQAYKAENPVATDEEIQAFLEENALQFPSSEESEIDELMEMLDDLTLEDELDPVEANGEAPKVEQGKEPGSKTHEKGDTPDTKVTPIQTGMLTSKADVTKKVRSQKVEDPTGRLPTKKADKRTVQIGSLFDGIKDELATLKQRQRIGRKVMEDRL